MQWALCWGYIDEQEQASIRPHETGQLVEETNSSAKLMQVDL